MQNKPTKVRSRTKPRRRTMTRTPRENSGSSITIQPVQTSAELAQFVDLPFRLYERSSNWIPPLRSDIRHLLDTNRHPFWKFARRELFLALRGDEVVGRIAAIVDPNYNKFQEEEMGGWGFFECINDAEVAESLFDAAAKWCKKQGMTFLRGPLSPSTNYETGMLLEGFDRPPSVMMPYNPPYYNELAESYGLVKEKDLVAFDIDAKDPQPPRIAKLSARIKRNAKIEVRSLDMSRFDEELVLLKELYKSAWEKNWGFVPMTTEEMDEMARSLKQIIDPELLVFATYNGEPAGVCMILPDINPVLWRLNGKLGPLGLLKAWWYRHEVVNLRGVLLGFKEEFRNLGVPLVVFDHLNTIIRGNPKYLHMELGWNLEDNDAINKFDEKIGGKMYKRYRLYRKEL